MNVHILAAIFATGVAAAVASAIAYFAAGASASSDGAAPQSTALSSRVPDVAGGAEHSLPISARLVPLQGQACLPPPAGMAAWWPLDEPAGPQAQDIVGGNNGQHIGGPNPTTGQVSGALAFDGVDDWVDAPRMVPTHDYRALTIDAWIFPASVQVPDQTIVEYGSLTYGLFLEGDELTVAIQTNMSYFAKSTSANVPANAWSHVAATADPTAGELKLYLNGQVVATNSSYTGTSFVASSGWQIGASSGGWWFGGLIDEVEIFERALNATEVMALYDAGAAGKCKPASCNPDVTPPTITCPLGISVADCNLDPLGVLGPATAVDDCDLSPAVANSVPVHLGGGMFEVTFTATDNAGNTASCTTGYQLMCMGCVKPAEFRAAWWPLSEGSGTATTDIVAANNGAHAGGAALTHVGGMVGGALDFPGGTSTSSGWVDAPRVTATHDYQNLTVDLWFSPRDLSKAQTLISYEGPAVAYALSIRSDGELQFDIDAGAGAFSVVSSAAGLGLANWHHVAATADTGFGIGELRLYVDGNVKGTTTGYVSSNVLAADGWIIGREFDGVMDEVEVHEWPLTAIDIQRIVMAGPYGKCPCTQPPTGMVGWWPLDEVAGSATAADFTNRGHTGQLRQSPLGGSNAPSPMIGKVDGAFEFGMPLLGQSTLATYVEIVDHADLNFGPTEDLTIDAWIYSTDPQEFVAVVDKLRLPRLGYSLFVEGNKLRFAMGDGNVVTEYGGGFTGLAVFSPDKPWAHVAVTLEREWSPGIDMLTLWVDGGPVVASSSGKLPDLSSPSPLLIGATRLSKQASAAPKGIDEVEIFDRALDGAEIIDLYSADSLGKCKDTCYVTWESVFQAGETRTVDVRICNYDSVPHTYNYTLAPTGAIDATCNLAITVAPNSGTTGLVSPGHCAVIPVTLGCPVGAVTGQHGCYTLSVVNNDTGDVAICSGSAFIDNSFRIRTSPSGMAMLDAGQETTVAFFVTNVTTQTIELDYELAAVRTSTMDPSADSPDVILNGRRPGDRPRGRIASAPGATVVISTTVLVTRPEPRSPHDLLLLADRTGDGNSEVVASVGLLTRPVQRRPAAVLLPILGRSWVLHP